MGNRICTFLAFLRTIRPRKSPSAKRTPALFMLPREILQHIRDFLPLESIVAFALCSRDLLRIMGDQSLHLLQLSIQAMAKLRFLTLSAKDLPDLRLCRTCHRFHPVWRSSPKKNHDAPLTNRLVLKQMVTHRLQANSGSVMNTHNCLLIILGLESRMLRVWRCFLIDFESRKRTQSSNELLRPRI